MAGEAAMMGAGKNLAARAMMMDKATRVSAHGLAASRREMAGNVPSRAKAWGSENISAADFGPRLAGGEFKRGGGPSRARHPMTTPSGAPLRVSVNGQMLGASAPAQRLAPPKRGGGMSYTAPAQSSLAMPSPSIRPSPRSATSAATQAANPVPSTGDPSSMIGSLAAIGGGAMMGGVTSYATGGSFFQGAAAGGMMGGVGHAGLSHRHKLAGMGESAVLHFGGGKASGFTGKMTEFANQFDSTAARRAAIGAGAMLGGFTFGGDRSHARGFNQHRGNRIGR